MQNNRSLFLNIFLSLLFFLNFTSAYADKNYESNLPESEVQDIFYLDLDDVIEDPFDWIKNRNTYIVIETKNGEKYPWFNVPNTQMIIYNYLDRLFPKGYLGNGINPYEIAKNKNYSHLMKENNYNTALQKFGFDLPTPSYIGEYPVVTMDILSVVLDNSPTKTLFKAIGTKIWKFFEFVEKDEEGELSYIPAPSDETLNTLYYLSPNDYNNKKNSFEQWIELYWDETMSKMEDGQVLLDDSMVNEQGVDSDGLQWIKANIINAKDYNGLHNIPKVVGNKKGENTPIDIAKKLQENTGPNYNMVVKNIILWAKSNIGAKDIDSIPERLMPYALDSLKEYDKQSLNYIRDPRAYIIDGSKIDENISGMKIPLNISNIPKSYFSNIFIKFSGFLSRWSVKFNELVSFDILKHTNKDINLDATILWKSPIGFFCISISILCLIIYVSKGIIKIISGKDSFFKIFINSIISMILIGTMSLFYCKPDKMFDISDKLSHLFLNLGSEFTMSSNIVRDLKTDNASDDEKENLSFWIPYFSMWTKYNIGYEINSKENQIDIKRLKYEPEQQENKQPDVQSNYIENCDFNSMWSLILAESFCDGVKINNNAYRVVDHFMSPRFKFQEKPLITAKENENYNGNFQNCIDFGLFCYVFTLFIGSFIKFLLFLEFIYELFMIQIHLALSSIRLREIKHTLYRFLFSLLRITMWDILLSMLILMSVYTSGIPAFIISLTFIFSIFHLSRHIISIDSNNVLTPRLLSWSSKFIYRHK